MPIDERLVFYEGKHVRLKALSPQDVVESDWVGWFNDQEMSVYNQHHYFPNTFEQQYDVLKALNTTVKLQFGIVDRADAAKICGVVSLSNINWVYRHAEIAGIQERARTSTNPALFLEAWSLMLRHGFQQLGLQKIYGGTFHPHVAGALNRMFNFVVEGVQRRQVFKDGAFCDVTLMGVFHDTIRYPEL
jgi:[ribosomal protein S5]-alanine N-acetyltransferase